MAMSKEARAAYNRQYFRAGTERRAGSNVSDAELDRRMEEYLRMHPALPLEGPRRDGDLEGCYGRD